MGDSAPSSGGPWTIQYTTYANSRASTTPTPAANQGHAALNAANNTPRATAQITVAALGSTNHDLEGMSSLVPVWQVGARRFGTRGFVMPLDERILAANAAARENAKQVLTIDVAVLTVGLALINALPDGVRLNSFGVLVAAILLLASGLAAVLVLDWTYRELRDGKAEERIGLWQTVELSLLLAGAGVAAGTAILAATT